LRLGAVSPTLTADGPAKGRGETALFWGLGEAEMDDQSKTRRAVSAAVIGNVLEWYDFAVYAYVAVYIARKFFPQGDEVTALLATFLAYGLGFVARPLGGIILGRVGDTHGRKTALLITIALMAVGTVMIGILPTYAAIGVAAPVLLVVARLLQGFSAGGEWGSSTAYIVEWAPAGQRGFYGSFQQTSVVAGLLLGSGIAALFATVLTTEQMNDWGWRVPFLLGGILGPVGLWMRRTIDETPAYTKAKAAPVAASTDTASNWLMAARAFGFTIVWTVCFYVLLNYMPTYTQKYLKISASAALWSNTIGLLALLLFIPIFGKLSDRIGRKPLLLACCVAYIVLPYPIFSFLLSGASYMQLIMVQILFAILIAMFSGPGPAAIAEIFPTRTRSTWMTSGYALSVAIFGGFAPFLSVYLIDRFNSPLAHTFYLMAAAIVSTIVIATLRETAREELR
jgi:MFS transporter, MHS family, proline/betaine transporter